MSDKNDRPVFVVKLEALPDDVPPYARLRRFLKMALRSYRLKCLSVTELPRPEAAEQPTDTTTPTAPAKPR